MGGCSFCAHGRLNFGNTTADKGCLLKNYQFFKCLYNTYALLQVSKAQNDSHMVLLPSFLTLSCSLSMHVGEEELAAIYSAMDGWSKGTCIRFVEWTDEPDYVAITKIMSG